MTDVGAEDGAPDGYVGDQEEVKKKRKPQQLSRRELGLGR